jgi:acyl phosphate:glycerol-3-phosphate acyltransferase
MSYQLLWILLVAYLVGSFPTGYLLVRLFLHKDIRDIGSGNIGTTNVIRTGAKGLGAATFVLDIFKGSLAVLLCDYLVNRVYGTCCNHRFSVLIALCAVLGHIFPVWLRFKGGKGVATAFGVFLVISPWAALAAFGIFILAIAITRYVSLGSILGSAAFPFLAWIWVPTLRAPMNFAILCIVPLLLIFKHHENITRLLHGTESKLGAKKIS